MSQEYVVGIDVGTSSVKAGIYGLDGVQATVASRPVSLNRTRDGGVTQDLDDLYAAAAGAVGDCVAALADPAARYAAMAVAGQMAGVGLVDAAHRPVAPYDSWLDSRCETILAQIDPDLARRILHSSGCAPTQSIGPKMAWQVRYRPADIARGRRFVTAAGYVAGRAAGLAGDQAFIDPTYLHFTSVADTAQCRWDHDLAAALGIGVDLLPRIIGSTQVIGHLQPETAAGFGLPSGLPIAAGCGDTAAGALGAGVTADGQAFDIAGTAAVFGIHLPAFTVDPAGTLLTMPAPLGEGYYALAYVGGAGEVIDWVCRSLFGHQDVDEAAYHALAAATRQAPAGCDGLLLSPHFSGRVTPAVPAMRGALVGLTPIHTRAHIARAVLEGIAYEYRGFAEAAAAVSGATGLHEVIGIGGGANLAEWNQIKADVLGTTYRPLGRVDAGTRGAALLALAATGAQLPAVDSGSYGQIARPDPAAATDYAANYPRYLAWTGHLADAYTDEATHPSPGPGHDTPQETETT